MLQKAIHYFNITPRERIAARFLTWNENWTYIHDKRRIDILLLGLYRCLFGSLNYDVEYKKLKDHYRDVSQMNVKKFFSRPL